MKNASGESVTVLEPAWRSFYVYYVAIFLCWFGPYLNPEFARSLWLSPTVGLVLGIILLAGVVYMKWGSEYRLSPSGVQKIRRYPPDREELAWDQVARLEIQRGLTHTLLDIGNIVIKPREGLGAEIVLTGLSHPKQVQDLMENLRR